MIKGKNRLYSIDEFAQICKESESLREVVHKMGYNANGGSTNTRIKQQMLQYNIDISHFKGQAHTKNKGKIKTETSKYLNNEVKVHSHKLRERLLYEEVFEYKCCSCGLTEWLGKPIPLELHHIDGDRNNNNLENLELRCPNCHYFTDTYKSKNRHT